MSARPLPPFGKQWLDAPPPAGLHVAIGPDAWEFSRVKPWPVPICPPENEPADFRWPSHPGGAVIYERGEFNDERLTALATELLAAGCPFAVAIREALLGGDPRLYYYREGPQ